MAKSPKPNTVTAGGIGSIALPKAVTICWSSSWSGWNFTTYPMFGGQILQDITMQWWHYQRGKNNLRAATLWVGEVMQGLCRRIVHKKALDKNQASQGKTAVQSNAITSTGAALANNSVEVLTQSLLDICVESWRFAKLVDRLLSKLDEKEQKRYRSQFRWFQKKVDESLNNAQLRVINMEEQPYDSGIPATPLNIEEFDSNDTLIVDQMLEPIITGPEGIVKSGTVILRKA